MKGHKTCCFIGHKKIPKNSILKEKLKHTIELLITDKNVDTFLFGSKSQFDSLCLQTVTELKKTYTHLRRVYVRAEFKYIDNNYHDYLLTIYDKTYFPEKITNSGKAIYIERNNEMINNSDFCIFYFDKNYVSQSSKSGTAIAYSYAQKKLKNVYNVFNQ